MLSANNLLRPQDGGPVTVPTQDMVLGSYYLTFERFENGVSQMDNDEYWPQGVDFSLAGKSYDELTDQERANVHMNIYRDEDEVLMAYNEHIIGVHQPVWIRVTREVNGEKLSHVVRATAGRIIFNRNIPQDLGFVKRYNDDGTRSEHFFDYEITETCGKKLLGKIVDRTIKQYGFTTAAEVLDNIKATGYKYSTRGSVQHGLYHQRRALQAGRPRVGKDHQRRYRRPDRQPGPLQPHLHDGGLRCPWFHEADPPADRYARPDGQHRR